MNEECICLNHGLIRLHGLHGRIQNAIVRITDESDYTDCKDEFKIQNTIALKISEIPKSVAICDSDQKCTIQNHGLIRLHGRTWMNEECNQVALKNP